jgi:replication factor C subunit 2/4
MSATSVADATFGGSATSVADATFGGSALGDEKDEVVLSDGDLHKLLSLTDKNDELSKKNEVSKKRGVPWLERYRPRGLIDLVGQESVVQLLEATLESSEPPKVASATDVAENKRPFPNFLFHGPPGTGKTSAILAVCRKLYGGNGTNELFASHVLQLNASMERGIDVIRDKIKVFSKLSAKKGCFKIVILDEADAMTVDAQSALRRIMEQYLNTTRFCILCNHIHQIIEPLISRTVQFRFQPLSVPHIEIRLNHIIRQEHIQIEPLAIRKIAINANGDLRNAITTLHLLVQTSPSSSSSSMMIKEEFVDKISVFIIPRSIVIDLLERITTTSNAASLHQLAQQCISRAMPILELLQTIAQIITENEQQSTQKIQLNEKALVSISWALALTEQRLIEGADELIQLTHLFSTIHTSTIVRNK